MEWRSEDEFRGGDPRRARPVEIEFGGQWFATVDEPPWRVCLLEATGELVAIQACEDDRGGGVRLLAAGVGRRQAERTLRGWWQVCGHRGSLPWIERRAALLGGGPETIA